MTEQERVQAALAEYEQFLKALQARYGVMVRQYVLTKEYADGEKIQQAAIEVRTVPNWQPPAPPEPPAA